MRHVNRKAATGQSTTLLTWQEALAILESCDERGVPIPFAIAFCTADESKNTGGEIIRYQKAIWHVAGGRVQKNDSFERVGGRAARTPRANWIRRIRGLDTDQIRNVHLHLITEINGHPVR